MFIGYEYVRVYDRVLWETDGSIDRPTDRRMSFKFLHFFGNDWGLSNNWYGREDIYLNDAVWGHFSNNWKIDYR